MAFVVLAPDAAKRVAQYPRQADEIKNSIMKVDTPELATC